VYSLSNYFLNDLICLGGGTLEKKHVLIYKRSICLRHPGVNQNNEHIMKHTLSNVGGDIIGKEYNGNQKFDSKLFSDVGQINTSSDKRSLNNQICNGIIFRGMLKKYNDEKDNYYVNITPKLTHNMYFINIKIYFGKV